MIATIFDTETTSLVNNHVIKLERQPYVLEIYACHVDLKTGKTFAEMEHLIRPPFEKDIDVEVAKKSHGITWAMVEDKPSFRDLADPIMTFLSRTPAVIAHNLAFDMEMIDIEVERIGRKMLWPERKICTVETSVFIKGSWLSLSDLHEHLFGMKFEGAHRAKNDVKALTKCCVEMFKRGWI